MSSRDARRGTVRWSHRSTTQPSVTCLVVLLFGGFLSVVRSSPVFPFTSFQASRNLRHLPCVVRNTGEEGICMFAIDCFKANGTHLGVCIDKIFFGSCCQVNDDRLLFDPDITDNSIDHNSVGNFPHFPQSSVMNTHRKPPLTETRLPTTASSSGNGTKYELVSSSTTTSRTTQKSNRRTTSTTTRTTKTPALKVPQQKDELQTTTEYQEFTTFQYVQSSKNPASGSQTTTSKRPSAINRPSSPGAGVTGQSTRPTSRTTTSKPYKNRRPTPNKTTPSRAPTRRPVQPIAISTEAPTTTPPSTTRKATGQNTRQPSPTVGSRRPPSSGATSQMSTTIASRRPSTNATTPTTPRIESTTPSVTYSRRPTTSPSLVPLTKPTQNRRRPTPTTTTTRTTTSVSTEAVPDTTRAPRPRPKPTSNIATVPATSLDHLIESQSSGTSQSGTTAKPTYPPTTVKVTQATSPTPTPTSTTSSSTTRTTLSEPTVQSSTVRLPESSLGFGPDPEDVATLSRPGLVTWTSILEDTSTERPIANQGPTTSNSWILIQTLTPEEVITTNHTNQHVPSPSPSTQAPTVSVEVSFSQDTKLPIESLLPEAAYVYDTVPIDGSIDLSAHSQVTGSVTGVSFAALAKTTESSLQPDTSTSERSHGSSTTTSTTTTRHSSIMSSTAESTVTQGSIVSSTEANPKPSSEAAEINVPLETTQSASTLSSPGTLRPGTTLVSTAAPPTLTTSSGLEAASSEESGTSSTTTTTAGSSTRRPPSSTEPVLGVRETTPAPTTTTESIESATEEGSGEEGSGSGEDGSSEEEEEEEEGEEEEEESTDESEESTTATTTVDLTTNSHQKVANESAISTTDTPTTTTTTTLLTTPLASTQTNASSTMTVSSTSTTLAESSTATTASTLSPVSISTGSVTSASSSSSTLSSTSTSASSSTSPTETSERTESSSSTTTTGMPIQFPESSPPTTLASLANVTTDGVTLAPDFLTTSTLPTLEGIDYRSVCGKRMFPEPRIVGGTKAAFGRWPWQISLRQWRTSTYLHKCGAALLNENWAITAAHCVDNVPPSDLLLRLGEYDLALEEEPYGYQERRVQIVASHPQFDPRTFEYDLALLRFYEPVIFQPNIIPVCVPENDENFIGRTAFVTGWGRLYEDGPLPSVLQEVTVPVIENKICETMYRSAGYIEHIPHIFICAGWKKGGYDSCEGDSGGPMVIQRPDKRFLLAGVISWGIGCAEPNQPGVYTRISEFRDWINQILQF
ncbi:mucin-5AC [Anopheles nili]|uniref:mucin-5AC n=1 Tax=Anopheles nili TaxID=185578 RepID=UPI00237C4748|nr:mucin-5AC [Anopheles nili]